MLNLVTGEAESGGGRLLCCADACNISGSTTWTLFYTLAGPLFSVACDGIIRMGCAPWLLIKVVPCVIFLRTRLFLSLFRLLNADATSMASTIFSEPRMGKKCIACQQ